ncbi:MAG: hypothetical protein M1816_006739 [Peltula sp. TS41687]|nr:MAG: hypothetical protein M1816_006739 [Peltula sp. TS41687]
MNTMTDKNYWDTYRPYLAQRTMSSMSYAERCYTNTNTIFQECSVFPKKRLSWTSERDAGCPFPGQNKTCLSNSGNIRFDTGYINSHYDLGINSPPEDRFLYRGVHECAPLHTVPYSEDRILNLTPTDTRKVKRYYYGDYVNEPFNFTYQYVVDDSLLNRTTGGPFGSTLDYTLAVHRAYESFDGSPSDTDSDFVPIPDLQRPAADISLMYLSANDVSFAEQTDDSWYSAHLPAGVGSGGPAWGRHENISLYFHDGPVRVVGCTSQHQYCNANVKPELGCTPLAGIFHAPILADSIWQTAKQRAMFQHSAVPILSLTNAMSLAEVPMQLKALSLTARTKLTDCVQGPLPDNQWQLEVEHWFTTILAYLQRAAVEQVTGPTNSEMNRFLERPRNAEEHLRCRSQKIRSDAFTSFSVLGLFILLGIGGLIIATSYTLEVLFGWMAKRGMISAYKRLEWISNETLQLHRLAHEELGFGTWSGTAEGLPVTAPAEKLATLDISDQKHPRLENPALKFEGKVKSDDDKC